MSHHSGNYGGQCPSNPPTLRDKVIVYGTMIGVSVIIGVLFWWALA